MRPPALPWLALALLALAGQPAAAEAPGLAPQAATATPPPAAALDTPEKLGEALFFDKDLSRARTQSCATCHDPSYAFADPRKTGANGAVSVGGDGHSLGVRNAPTLAYSALTPPFGRTAQGDQGGGKRAGGFFLDGRADTLKAQAGQPILNPVEMAMPDKASVVGRLKEKPAYVAAFQALYGRDVFQTPGRAYGALGAALAAYEATPVFARFDSKYDRYLKGEYQMTPQEELGRVLFFSNQFTNCHQCHKLTASGGAGETFTNHQFHNIGVPANPALNAPVDHGLMAGRKLKDRRTDGQFKVPTLRNVAVTAPYMHNGVFQDLRTTLLFYNQFVSHAPARKINPETGAPWAPPEVPGTVSEKELKATPALDDKRIDALVAFLRTLTDERYEGMKD